MLDKFFQALHRSLEESERLQDQMAAVIDSNPKVRIVGDAEPVKYRIMPLKEAGSD